MSWNNQVNTEKIMCPKNVELVHSEYKPVSNRVLHDQLSFKVLANPFFFFQMKFSKVSLKEMWMPLRN